MAFSSPGCIAGRQTGLEMVLCCLKTFIISQRTSGQLYCWVLSPWWPGDVLIVIRKTDNISINSGVIIKQSIIILSLLHPSGKLETSHPQPWEHEIYWKNKDVPLLSVRWSLASRAPRWYQCSRRNYPQWAVLINRSGSCSFQRAMGVERRHLVETKHFYISTAETSTTVMCYHLWVRLHHIILKYKRFEVRELLSFYCYDNESMSTVLNQVDEDWPRSDRSLISIPQLTVQDDD